MMPPIYRTAEITLYSVLNFLPYLALAMYPFRNRLRYSPAVTAVLTMVVTVLQIALGFCAVFLTGENKGVISAVSTAVYGIFFLWGVKTHIGKILFTLLMISNISNFIVSSAKCIEGILFPALAQQRYRWSASIVMLVIQLVVLLPVFFYVRCIYEKALTEEAPKSIWRYLWLVPATFYFIWFYYFYGSANTGIEVALQPENMFFLLFINLGALLVYSIAVKLIEESNENLNLLMQNRLLALENLQYRNLKEKINDTRRARHDLRHHIAVMTGYLNDGETERLKAYLNEYLKSLPDDGSIVYCRNYVVNLVLLYFAQQAEEAGIDFVVHVKLPEQIEIAESDLSVVLGNLLENAVDACAAQKKGLRRIIVGGRCEAGAALFTVDNTFEGELKRRKDGTYLSTKHKGTGLGIESVRHIAGRYQGSFACEEKEGMFYASVLLNFSEEALHCK